MVRACKSNESALFEVQEDGQWKRIDEYLPGLCDGVGDNILLRAEPYDLVELCKECAIKVGLEW
jgi:hypothetical protein